MVLTHRCPPASCPCTRLLLAETSMLPVDEPWRPGQQDPQRACQGRLCVAFGGPPAAEAALGARSHADSENRAKWRVAAAPQPRRAGHMCAALCLRRAGKVRVHAGRRPERSGGGTGSHARQWKCTRPTRSPHARRDFQDGPQRVRDGRHRLKWLMAVVGRVWGVWGASWGGLELAGAELGCTGVRDGTFAEISAKV